MGKLEKITAWKLTKVRSKKEVIDWARTTGAKVHFASLMDICHLKNAELEAKDQKYKDRVVLRDDIVKDDSGSYAVFSEEGSSASQMTAAKVMDTISRLPGCDGQAADAVSVHIQVKMEHAYKLLKIPKSECPDIWIRLPRHKWPKQRVILICVCGCHKIGWKETSQQRSWFGRINIFPWSCIFGNTQRQCEISKDIVDNYRTMFESRSSAGGTENFHTLRIFFMVVFVS